MGKAIRVHLLDHSPLIASAIKRLLETEKGFNIEVHLQSGCARPCAQECMHPPPDVLVIDPNMHGVCGLDCIRRIRTKHPQARILVLSAHDDDISVNHAMQAGASGFISKHAPPSRLFQAIHDVATVDSFLDGRAGEEKQPPAPVNSPLARLSHREFEVMTLMLDGMGRRQIAEALFLSESTVANHHTRILRKLGVSNIVELTRLAMKQGLI